MFLQEIPKDLFPVEINVQLLHTGLMKISDILQKKKLTVSFEIFPPKEDSAFEGVIRCANELSSLTPDFISVTYGAGGGTSSNTVKIVSHLQDSGVTPIAHLTCLSSSRLEVHHIIDELHNKKIVNIMALRGDRPRDPLFIPPGDYRYASDLVTDILSRGDFCVGGACYPEGHPESETPEQDIHGLKAKIDAGASFLTTQMFFDNEIFSQFIDRAHSGGIHVPILAGIMPVTNARQIKRMIELSGACIPAKLQSLIDRFGHDDQEMKKAGIDYAIEQIVDLPSRGTKGIHLYAMNKSDVVGAIVGGLGGIERFTQ